MEAYKKVKEFMRRHPGTVAFRLRSHAKVLDEYVNDDEELLYVFAGQKNNTSIGVPNTFIVGLTSRRLVFARKRLIFGHFFYSVTPDLFNDLKVKSGLIWGRIMIDTMKELAIISNIAISALDEVETAISKYMMDEKQKYAKDATKKDSK